MISKIDSYRLSFVIVGGVRIFRFIFLGGLRFGDFGVNGVVSFMSFVIVERY